MTSINHALESIDPRLHCLTNNVGAPIDFFETLPDEVLLKIFLEVTNKRKSSFERIEHSGLKDLRCVSKRFRSISRTAMKELISEQAISLKKLGCTNGQQAIDYVIKNQLNSINLEDFPDIHDRHIHQLIDRCPKLSRLLIKSDRFYGQMGFTKLKELRELQIESKWILGLDLSQNEMLEEVRLNYCCRLLSLTLPNKAPNLQNVTCYNCGQLESLTLPDQALQLEYIDCTYCENLSSLSLPNEIPLLKQVWAPKCVKLSSVFFPKEAPRLKTIWLPNCEKLSNIEMPKNAPSLETIELFSNDLTSLVLPEITPSLKKINCAGNRSLTSVTMPNEAQELKDCNFSYCRRLTSDHILQFEKYRSVIRGILK